MITPQSQVLRNLIRSGRLSHEQETQCIEQIYSIEREAEAQNAKSPEKGLSGDTVSGEVTV
jgi:hypothetical protein